MSNFPHARPACPHGCLRKSDCLYRKGCPQLVKRLDAEGLKVLPGIHLHIKGGMEDAALALYAHGINPSDRLTEIRTYTPKGMTDYFVSDVQVKAECEPGVLRWFCEPPGSDRRFPVGALLHYSVEEQPI